VLIGINALGKISQDAAAKTYISNFIRCLSCDRSGHEYVFLVSDGEQQSLPEGSGPVRVLGVPGSSESPYQKVWAEQVELPRIVRAERCDRMFFPASMAAYLCPVPYVLNVSAMLSFYAGYGVHGPRRMLRNWLIPRSVRRAAAVITPSEALKRDVVRFCGVSASRVRAVANGVDAEMFGRRVGESEVNRVLARFGLRRDRRMILYVSSLLPHKNHEMLLRAFRRLVDRSPTDHILVLVGRGVEYSVRGHAERLFSMARELGLGDRVVFTGAASQDELAVFYQSADVMVFPSRIESFGLPVLEAMAAGTPVISSSAHALSEVAGDAALLVDPNSEEALTEAMARVLASPDLRRDLAARGRRRATAFSWSRCVATTVSIITDPEDSAFAGGEP